MGFSGRHLGFALLGAALAACGSDGLGPAPELPVECDASNTLLLPVGGAVTRAGGEARTSCLQAPDGGAEFVLVPFAATSESSQGIAFDLYGENVRSASGPPSPAPEPSPASGALGQDRGRGAGGTLRGAGDDRDGAFHARLRGLERRDLAPLVGPGTAPTDAPGGAPARARSQLPPEVGDLLTLNAQARVACDEPIHRTGRVVAITEGTVVAVDTASPPGGFDDAEYASFGATFDTLITRVTDRNFGSQITDLDGNGRVILFFTPEVNRLTEQSSSRFIGGFFFARDLFPRVATESLQACAHSNEGEVLYMMVPDPEGTVNDNRRTLDFVRRTTPNTLVHEHQHLINAARRLHILQASEPFEEVWLNEALSHSAEELLFFEISGLAPRANLRVSDLQSAGSTAVNAANAHHVPNLLRLRLFLRAPSQNSPYADQDGLEARGASQSFLRYALDRHPQDDAAILRALVDAGATGWTNLAARLGGEITLREWLTDWSVALYADDRVSDVPTKHALRSWNLPSLYDGLDIRPFPIDTRSLPSLQDLRVELAGGGAAYVRFGVDAGEVARVMLNRDGSPLSSELRVTVLRTR